MRLGLRLSAALCATVLAPAPPASALDPRKAVTQYSHQVWETKDGLPQNSVQAIVQTPEGYLWLGTQEGLVRFDGVRFTTFDKKTTPAILNNNVQALAVGRDGSLWIGTGGGGLVRLKDGRFSGYTRRQGLANDSIWALLEDRQGLWIGTAGGGLARLRDGVFTTYTTKEGLGSDNVLSLAGDRTGALWVGTDGGGLARLAGGSLTVYRARDGLAGDTVSAIREDAQGRLWIGTAGGLSRFEGGRFTTFTTRDGLPADRVDALLSGREGGLWAGTYGGGLARWRDGRFERYASSQGLSNDMVKALYEDAEGSLWVGTRTGGLNRFKDGAVVSYSESEGLSKDFVWSVLEDPSGTLWLGTDGGGVSRFRDGVFESITTRNGLSHDMVRALAVDRGGALWVGTYGGGLDRLEDGRVRAFTTKDGLSHNFIRALYPDREGNLWIGTYGGGLNRLRDGRVRVFTERDGLGADTVYCMLEDQSGDLWVGTRGGGLSRLHAGRFTTFGARDGLSDEVVLSLHEDAAGSLWIGTTGGLNRMKDGRIRSVTRRQGLYDDVVFAILEDRRGSLWMSCNRGIFRVVKSELEEVLEGRAARVTSVAYGTADGMKSAECNGGVQPPAWKARDGRLWFPTIRGVAVVDPARVRSGAPPPPVAIEEVAINGDAFDPRAEAVAPPGRGELHFRYTGLSLLAPEKLRFKRRLEGYDPAWVDAGARREADYTNIPPGRYTFRVISGSADGGWNEAGAACRILLRPHVYQTGWFRGLCLLGVLLAGTGAYGLRVRNVKRRQRELSGLVEQRTRSLAEATGELKRANRELRETIRLKDEVVGIVAHDFRAPLGLIQGYGELLEEQAPDAELRQMCGVLAAQSRHLAALVADTLTMSRIETGSLPLDVRPVKIAGLVRRIVETRAAEPGVDVRVEAADESQIAEADPERLHQVVDNLVDNALKYSPSGAPVRVVVERGAAGVHVSVSDRGMGIAPDEVGRLFQRFSRLEGARRQRISGTGLGLYICRSIVESHGGRIWVESEPGQGSTFHFTIPFEQRRPPPGAAP